MNESNANEGRSRTALSLFTGAGGLDLGFEQAGFRHLEAIDFDHWSVETLRKNRPEWSPKEADATKYFPEIDTTPDVLLAGPPCQGFSLGGSRKTDDPRNLLYREVIRVARLTRPRVVLIENVLNLRTMRAPDTGRPFVHEFAEGFRAIGYDVQWQIFSVAGYGAPQTRRRFIFFAALGRLPKGFAFPEPSQREETIRSHLYDLAQATIDPPSLPNHEPKWGFHSRVHEATGGSFDPSAEVVPVRFSRTASDGYPIRSFDCPFPAVDTATVWGWAQGNVAANRIKRSEKDVAPSTSKYANPPLWRLRAVRFRKMTPREFARLQTFPDDWEFVGGTAERDILKQVGNAVPVEFARRLGLFTQKVLDAIEGQNSMVPPVRQMMLW